LLSCAVLSTANIFAIYTKDIKAANTVLVQFVAEFKPGTACNEAGNRNLAESNPKTLQVFYFFYLRKVF
jgi:hypothetical protein